MALLTIEQHEILDSIIYQIERKASTPDAVCWLTDDDGNDSDESYCFDCIQLIVSEPKHGENYCRAGYAFDYDNPVRCEKCGKLLDYTLTSYGVEYELGYFVEYPPANLSDSDDCFELARVVNGLWTDEQKITFLHMIANACIT